MKKTCIVLLLFYFMNSAFAAEPILQASHSSNLCSVNNFATKIKNKYPVYKSVNNVELVYKFIKKYPQNKECLFFTKDEQIQMLHYQISDQQKQINELQKKLSNQKSTPINYTYDKEFVNDMREDMMLFEQMQTNDNLQNINDNLRRLHSSY